jgi:RNase adaptor protein for sRNA GlmZ degradation
MNNCKDLISALGASGMKDCFSNSTVAEENGKKFTLINPSRKKICKVKVDGCLIKAQTARKCDYMFEVSGKPNKYYLVELKGGDVVTAVDQIISTYSQVNAKIKSASNTYKGIVVSSGVPGAEQRFRSAQTKSLKDHGIMILKKTNQHSEIV